MKKLNLFLGENVRLNQIDQCVKVHVHCPPKVLGQFVKFTKFIKPRNSSNPTQYNQFSAKKLMLGTKQYGSKIRPNVSLGLIFDPYCLLKINPFFEIVRKYFILFNYFKRALFMQIISLFRQQGQMAIGKFRTNLYVVR